MKRPMREHSLTGSVMEAAYWIIVVASFAFLACVMLTPQASGTSVIGGPADSVGFAVVSALLCGSGLTLGILWIMAVAPRCLESEGDARVLKRVEWRERSARLWNQLVQLGVNSPRT